MQVDVAIYMEPMLFSRKPEFLAGSNGDVLNLEKINDEKLALHLLFEQQLPEQYLVWSDFFAEITSELFLNPLYKQSQEAIKKQMMISKGDALKENIRKRKEYLLKKKMGLAENKKYEDFISEVSDEAIYMLSMVSTQRYINGIVPGSPLEEIYEIFKAGAMPCGVKKNKDIVVFNPAVLK
ncbi:hypothetical protein SMY33_002186 [Cronobacter malonaticus]|uniref:hypothetical protein n=1 Tax=Cronobacter malonaticus TaxID=413503 RepID=UPI000CFC6B22|nr:hypothetical protein [Cronobacter malonaticus]EKY3233997.1 hypothetical protein [Cronobacter malonaticus]ELY4025708.1 hypothetical protein [Cronobacter malonaticus]ELY5855559.1 hypothetical protein [Cronobacter malonaticus]MDI7687634.1 hypothetical protein [Cronobacter malonaticus]MEB8479556.1 hypothetical protein [Cronobacter malonaticus]